MNKLRLNIDVSWIKPPLLVMRHGVSGQCGETVSKKPGRLLLLHTLCRQPSWLWRYHGMQLPTWEGWVKNIQNHPEPIGFRLMYHMNANIYPQLAASLV